jgi:sigma-B regulation protein RsbU (phosphoserine phosphatase)
VVEPRTRDVRLVNAGHPPPIRIRANTLETVRPGGPALGVLQDVQFEEQVVRLDAHDALVVFSDGVSEAMNADRDFYGEERLAGVLARGPYPNAQALAAAVLDDVTSFVGTAPWHDDVSLIVVMRTN